MSKFELLHSNASVMTVTFIQRKIHMIDKEIAKIYNYIYVYVWQIISIAKKFHVVCFCISINAGALFEIFLIFVIITNSSEIHNKSIQLFLRLNISSRICEIALYSFIRSLLPRLLEPDLFNYSLLYFVLFIFFYLFLYT